jgi:transcription elongation GreA/GreB family factor
VAVARAGVLSFPATTSHSIFLLSCEGTFENHKILELKQHLITHLISLLDDRMAVAWKAMEAAQESANDQSKSSAGDKYETSRSMGQLDRNMHARQYEQARQERTILERLQGMPELNSYERVAIGSLIKTTAGYFFIAVSAGAINLEGETILAVSAATPIGQSLIGKEVKDTFLFKTKKQKIENIL